MKTLKVVCFIIFTLCAGFALVEIGLTARSTSTSITHLVSDLDETDQKMDVVLDRAAKVEDTANDAAQQEQDFFRKLQPQAFKFFEDAKHLVGTTDISINGGLEHGHTETGLVPSLETTLRATTNLQNSAATNLTDTRKVIDSVILSMQPGIVDANKAFAGAAAAMSSPDVIESMDHFTSATAHIDATTAKVQEGVTHEVNTLMAPVSKAKAIVEFIATVVGRFY